MSWLFSLQVDMPALRQMGDGDLKELGIPMVTSLAPKVFIFVLSM